MTVQSDTRQPRPDRRAARREATRDEIIAAAWALVRERGLAGLAMRDLGERVGMKAQSIYSYFASKHEIYDAMFHEGYGAFLAQMADLHDASSDDERPRDRAQRAAHRFFTFCTSDPVRYQLLFQRTIPDFVPSAESYALAVASLDQMKAQMASIGIVGDDAIDLWTALLTGLTDQQISNDPGGDRWERLLDRAVDMMLRETATTFEPSTTDRR